MAVTVQKPQRPSRRKWQSLATVWVELEGYTLSGTVLRRVDDKSVLVRTCGAFDNFMQHDVVRRDSQLQWRPYDCQDYDAWTAYLKKTYGDDPFRVAAGIREVERSHRPFVR